MYGGLKIFIIIIRLQLHLISIQNFHVTDFCGYEIFIPQDISNAFSQNVFQLFSFRAPPACVSVNTLHHSEFFSQKQTQCHVVFLDRPMGKLHVLLMTS